MKSTYKQRKSQTEYKQKLDSIEFDKQHRIKMEALNAAHNEFLRLQYDNEPPEGHKMGGLTPYIPTPKPTWKERLSDWIHMVQISPISPHH